MNRKDGIATVSHDNYWESHQLLNFGRRWESPSRWSCGKCAINLFVMNTSR